MEKHTWKTHNYARSKVQTWAEPMCLGTCFAFRCRTWKRTCAHGISIRLSAARPRVNRARVWLEAKVRLLKLEDVSWTGFTNMLAVTWTRHVPWSRSSTRFFNTSIECVSLIPSLNMCSRRRSHHPTTPSHTLKPHIKCNSKSNSGEKQNSKSPKNCVCHQNTNKPQPSTAPAAKSGKATAHKNAKHSRTNTFEGHTKPCAKCYSQY